MGDLKMQLQSQGDNLQSRRGDDLEFREKMMKKNHELAEAMEELQVWFFLPFIKVYLIYQLWYLRQFVFKFIRLYYVYYTHHRL